MSLQHNHSQNHQRPNHPPSQLTTHAQAATEDYTQNNISHRFDSTKQAKGLDAVTRLFTLLRPDSLHAFSAARYCRSDHIAPHDDRAYTQVRGLELWVLHVQYSGFKHDGQPRMLANGLKAETA